MVRTQIRILAATVTLVALFVQTESKAQTTYTWNLDLAGTWDTATTNWLSAGAPATWVNGNNIAVFGNKITASRAIAVVAGGVTAGQVSFDHAGGFFYTVGTAGQTITLNNGASDAQIGVTNGSLGSAAYAGNTGGNTITGSSITFFNNLNIVNDGAFGTTSLTLAGAINRNVAGGNVTFSGQGITAVSGAIGSTITGGLVKNGNGTVNLSSITNAFTGSITVNGGVLANTTSNDLVFGNTANGIVLNAGGTLRLASAVTLAAARVITVNGTSTNASGLDLGSGVTQIIGASQLAGSGVLNLTITNGTTAGTLSIEGANAGFTGSIVVGGPAQMVGHTLAQKIVGGTSSGVTLRLQNAGTLANAAAITINNNSSLVITQPTTAVTGRLGSSTPITLNTGRFQYNSNTNGGTAIAESMGGLTLSGTGIISGSSASGTTGGTSVTFSSLTRNDKAGLWFRGPTTGTGAIGGTPGAGPVNYKITGLAPLSGLGTAAAGVIPWAASIASTTGSDPANLITYDANGFRPLAASEQSIVTSLATLTAAAGNNVNLQGSVAMSGNVVINSLFNSTGTPGLTGTGILTVTSGAVSTFNTMTINGPTLDFGSATGYFHLGFPIGVTGVSSITGSGGIATQGLMSSTSSTSYQLRFTNTVANTFTGGLFINGNSQVTFTANNQLGQDGGGLNAGAITLGGGQLLYAPGSASTANLTDSANNRNISVNASNGTIGTTFAGAKLQIAGTISGVGQLQFGGGVSTAATGIVELTNSSANTYSGGTIIGVGTLRLSNANQLGTGGILLNGGTLQASGNLNFSVSPTVTASSTIDTQANSITLGGGLNGSGGTLGTSALTLAVTKNGTGALTFGAAGNFAGTLTASAGSGTIAFSGNGKLSEVASVTMGSGTLLHLDNAATNASDRLYDKAGISLGGAEFKFTGNASASSAETLGVLSTTASTSNTITIVTGTGQSAVVTFSSFNPGSGATTLFRGDSLGGGPAGQYSRIVFSTAPTLTGGLMANALVDTTSSGLGDDLATYDSTVDAGGVVGVKAAAGAPVAFISNPAVAATTNALIVGTVKTDPGAANLSASYNQTVNSLTMGPGSGYPTLLITPQQSLTVTSGIVLVKSTAPGAVIQGGKLASSGASSGLTFLLNADLQIGSAMVTGTAGVTKTGNGRMILTNSNILPNAPLAINAGTMYLGTTSQTVSSLSGTAAAALHLGTGTLISTMGGSSTFAGTIYGAGGNLRLEARGVATGPNLTLTGNNTYGGSTYIGLHENLIGTGLTNQPFLTLSGGGTIGNTSGLTIGRMSSVAIVQSAGALAGRINSTANITLNAGQLAYSSGGALALNETFGNLTVNGYGYTSFSGGAPSTTLNFGTLTLNDNATIYMRAASATGIGGTPGSATVNVKFSGSLTAISDPLGGAGGTNVGIVPFLAVPTSTSGTDPQALATYDANGVRSVGFTSAEFVQASNFSTMLANQNNNLTSTTYAMTGNLRVNSLGQSTSGTSTLTGAFSLGVYSGAIGNFGTLNFSGPTIDFAANTGYFHLGFPVNIQTTSSITGSNGVVVSGLGSGSNYTLTMSNSVANTFTGGLFVNGNATVAFSADNQLGDLAGGITLSGGGLSYSTAAPLSLNSGRAVKLGAAGGFITVGSAAANPLTIAGNVSGPGSLLKNGAGTLVLSGSNSYQGATIVGAGTLRLNSGGALPSGTSVYLGSPNSATAGTLDLNGQSASIAGLQNSLANTATTNAVISSVGGASLTVNNSVDYVYAGNLGGTGANGFSLSKTGAGSLNLTSNGNTYSGGTTISGGTLYANNTTLASSATGAGAVTVGTGGTLGGSGRVATSVGGIVVSGGTIAPGNSGGILTVAPTTVLDLSGGGTYSWELAALTTSNPGGIGVPQNFDQIAMTSGDLVLGGTSTFQINFASIDIDPNSSDPFWNVNQIWDVLTLSGTATNNGLTQFSSLPGGVYSKGFFTLQLAGTGGIQLMWNFNPVPEPSTVLAFAAFAAAGLAVYRRKRAGND